MLHHIPRPFGLGIFCGGRYRTRTARAERSEGNQSPSGALISARFPMRRNVYQERCRQTIRSGDFLLCHPLTCVRAGRYRARTARPRRRRGNQSPSRALISARFPTRRNVYQERCRQTIRSGDFLWRRSQDEDRNEQRQGIIITMVSCLLCDRMIISQRLPPVLSYAQSGREPL